MLCAQSDIYGVVSITPSQPADLTTCALVIPTAGDLGNNPFALSPADGTAVASAIVLVWGAGFACRALIRSLSSHGESENV